MDDGILQTPGVKERLLPDVIDGPHENAIYLTGAVSSDGLPPFVYFWNGQAWHSVKLPDVAERITAMHVASEQRIWLCGANGTLLVGNAQEGFRSLSTYDDNQLFTSITEFEGRMYLASNYGLFVYDPQKHWQGIQRVKTTLKPDLQDANIVDAVDGVLWSIGPKDIARFDGQQWERINNDDNPRIEEPKADGWEG
jgi:ligand-binding sensor domain-containing protein